MNWLVLVFFASVLALAYAAKNFYAVKKLDEGTRVMRDIAASIRTGATAFLNYEFRVISLIVVVVAVVMGVLVGWYVGAAFLIGATMSSLAALVGMRIATYANVRVSNTARTTKKLGKTLKVAFTGGSVMGLCVGGFALLGLVIVYVVFGLLLKQLSLENVYLFRNWLGIEFSPFTMTISGYALGCSIIAMFFRVGGGIYTKAADMGADLVGKVEAGIPEDDPRNPATIADNVGDNVGDVAGLGSDLLESFVGAISSGVILAFHLFLSSEAKNGGITPSLLQKMFMYPVVLAGLGLLACIIGIAYIILKKELSEDPHRELNMSTWVSAGLTVVLAGLAGWYMFRGENLIGVDFRLGAFSPWIAAVLGIVAGVVIGLIAEYYTSYDYAPTKSIASASLEGPALTITQGMAVGMRSTMAPVLVLGATVIAAYGAAGMYGIAMAAVGMLSFVSTTVTVDTYGPISDNAGGIAEMSKLDEEVRAITDKLDSVGNTTAAIGKGFAIGSAALAATSLMVAYIFSFSPPEVDPILDIINPMTLVGAMVGTALPYLFSGMLIESVTKAARKMVDEVRRQFKEKPGILEGTEEPDVNSCVSIASEGALQEMKLPSYIALAFPLVGGFIFGANFVGGILIGAIMSAIMLALYTGNAGGAWDNGKKYIETGALNGHGKGGPVHAAAVVGDTVGDPLKDTVGPSLDILIKIMSTISLIAVAIFAKYNLFAWLSGLF
ncbi:MAG TPA: sodium-translocating pyrophosphatase [Limnochordia bacterium]|jgi:K(+)-stimulated pyrophosphate-energized sodium pump|nr:sodium-translocating pyrophosphatase [Limnochordia bacterium]HOK31783.1 sodium-translocating pyrophosphatase [Limnochordia bacterium]HPP73020.1 sodium-translocating pyrophosphatase [Limnochordia bacterium]HPZ80077.1 sodium-translocating pyrophosphatase [Limnochordia bacterium]HQE36676.1 sodium-translocating pyrophosphatase [Limnochordia bacterium]